jgi:hypothetical protein
MPDHAVRPGNSGIQASPMFGVVTPSDTVDLPYITRGIYVGATGDVAVVPASGGAPVVFAGVAAGTILPIQVSRIRTTGSTSTSIVALY